MEEEGQDEEDWQGRAEEEGETDQDDSDGGDDDNDVVETNF